MNNKWYYAKGGEKYGPMSSPQLKFLAASGDILASDFIWREGIERWQPAAQVEGLFPTNTAVDATHSTRQSERFRSLLIRWTAAACVAILISLALGGLWQQRQHERTNAAHQGGDEGITQTSQGTSDQPQQPLFARSEQSHDTSRSSAFQLSTEQQEAFEKIKELGGFIYVDPSTPGHPIRKIMMVNCSGSDLRWLKHFPDLPELHIRSRRVENISYLASLKELRLLDITDTKVSPEALATVAELKSLEYVALPATTGEGLSYVGQLASLHSLDLSRSRKGEEGESGTVLHSGDLRHIGGLTALEHLAMPAYSDESDLAHVADLRNLKVLEVCNSRLGGQPLRCIEGLDALERLKLDFSPYVVRYMEEHGLAQGENLLKRLQPLQAMARLQELCVSGLSDSEMVQLDMTLPDVAITEHEWHEWRSREPFSRLKSISTPGYWTAISGNGQPAEPGNGLAMDRGARHPNRVDRESLTAEELKQMSYSQIVDRLGQPDEDYRSSQKRNVGLAIWQTGDNEYTVIGFAHAIDGSGRTLVLSVHDRRPRSVVERMKRSLDASLN